MRVLVAFLLTILCSACASSRDVSCLSEWIEEHRYVGELFARELKSKDLQIVVRSRPGRFELMSVPDDKRQAYVHMSNMLRNMDAESAVIVGNEEGVSFTVYSSGFLGDGVVQKAYYSLDGFPPRLPWCIKNQRGGWYAMYMSSRDQNCSENRDTHRLPRG